MPNARHRRRTTTVRPSWKGWRNGQRNADGGMQTTFAPIDKPRIESKRKDSCSRCDKAVEVGDLIVWIPPRRSRGKVVTKAKVICDECARGTTDG